MNKFFVLKIENREVVLVSDFSNAALIKMEEEEEDDDDEDDDDDDDGFE